MRAALCAASVRACLRRACSRRACVVQDAAAAAEDMLRRKDKLGKRRMRTFKLVDDDIELDDAEENIEDVVQDEMLAPVFFDEQLRDDAGGGLRSHHLKFAIASAEMFEEAGAGDASEPGAGAAADGAGKQRDKREIKGTTNPTPAGRMRALYSSRFVRGATRRGGLLSLSLPLLWPLSPSQCTSRCQTRRQRQRQGQRQRQEQRQRRKQRPGCDRQ